MASTSGAVFFLGARPHYQSLEAGTSADQENGNELIRNDNDCQWDELSRSQETNSDIIVFEYCENRNINTSGITRRFRGKRNQDGYNEHILSDDEIDMASLENYESDAKSRENNCVPLRALLSNLRPRRRKTSSDSMADQCTFKDSCRCLDCQSRYFECDSEASLSDCDEYFQYESDSESDTAELQEEYENDVEMAAGTPVILNYLLNHPVSCSIQ